MGNKKILVTFQIVEPALLLDCEGSTKLKKLTQELHNATV